MKNIQEFKFEKVRKEIGGVTVYNIESDLRNYLTQKYLTEMIDKKGEIKPDVTDTMTELIQVLTNINFDGASKEEIVVLMKNSDDELREITKEVEDMLVSCMHDSIRIYQQTLQNMMIAEQGKKKIEEIKSQQNEIIEQKQEIEVVTKKEKTSILDFK